MKTENVVLRNGCSPIGKMEIVEQINALAIGPVDGFTDIHCQTFDNFTGPVNHDL